MYQNRFTRILSVALAVQMAVPPFALAQTPAGTAQPRPAGAPRTAAPVSDQRGDFDDVAAIMRGTSTVFSNITSAMQQQAAANAAQNQANSLKQEMNPQNCGTISQPVACVSEIFPQCQILNTFPNLVEPSECTDGVDGSSPNAGIQAGVAAGYYAHFSLMENEYKLKGLESNNTSNIGIGCLNAKAEELQRNLKKREDEIDNLINKMQKEQDNFKAQAERERNTIDEAMALLEGGNYKSDRSKAVLEQNSVKFSDVFKNNNACSAVLDSEAFKGEGSKAGFKGIEARLSSIANKKEGSGSSFSAMEFNQNTAERIEADVKRMSSLAAREIQSKGDEVLTKTDAFKGLPSAYGLANSPAFTAALLEQTKAAELDKADILKKTQKFVDSGSQSLLSELQNDSVDFEFVLNKWERTEKNACLTRNSNISGLISQDLNIIDPSGSKEANKFSDNAYRTFIKDTLRRGDISIEKKMELIAAEERRDGNNRFIVDTQASATSGDSTLKQSSKNSPANFINRIVENCKDQFDDNKNDKGVSRREVMTEMRKVRSEMMNYRKTLAGNVQKALVNRIMNCQDSGTANAAGIAICSSKDLSTSSPNFCVKRANSCATNMRQCLTAAENEVKKVTTVRDASVAQYKANMARHEDNLKKMYLLTENITSLDGLNIAATLKQGLVLPTNLKFHLDQKDRTYAKGLEAMEIQEPDQYFELMKKNLLALKAEVKKQNDQVMKGAPGAPAGAQQGVMGHIANIKKNMENVIQNMQEYKNACKQSYQAYNRGVQDANKEAAKAANERQAELAKVCNRFNTLRNSPVPGCGGVSDLSDEMQKVGSFGGGTAMGQLQAYGQLCQRYSSTQEDKVDFATIARGTDQSVKTVCDKYKTGNNAAIEVCRKAIDCPGKITAACSTITDFVQKGACREQFLAGEGSECKGFENDTVAKAAIASVLSTNPEFQNARAEQFQQALADNGVNSLGEIQIPACAAFDNSGANAIGKALQDVGSQFGTSIVNGAVQPQ